MGKQRKYRFPQGINGLNRLFRPHLHPHPQTSPDDINGTRYYDMTDDSYYNDMYYGSDMYSDTDPFGQYTGMAFDGSMPIQDADDL